ncbi:transposon-transfer assisting family protein (plasmid) [Oscillospiraceae bacterium PP1C4]
MATFLQEEIAIMAMYRIDTKEHLLADLTEAAPHIDDPVISAYISDIIEKLSPMNEVDFEQLTFMPDIL